MGHSISPAHLSLRKIKSRKIIEKVPEINYLSRENEPRMEFIDGDQLRRCSVEAGGQTGQRVVTLNRVGQRVLGQAAIAAAAPAGSSFSDTDRTTRTSTATSATVCKKEIYKNKKANSKQRNASITINGLATAYNSTANQNGVKGLPSISIDSSSPPVGR